MENLAVFGGEPVRDDYLTFGDPDIREEEIKEVEDTLRSGWIGTGPKTTQFEEEFADYIKVPYAIALNSCTAGLYLSLIVLGIKSGDEIITTPMTFAATANVICHVGAIPIFADIDPCSFNISPASLEKKITDKTKAVIPVHFGGYPCDMDEIMEIAERYDLVVIEDAAHAVGAEYKGGKIGSLGNLTSFSFHATKNITTIEGGMVTTTDKDLADRIRLLSNHGLSSDAWKRFSLENNLDYEVREAGFKYNMTDVQSSLGIHQLRRLEDSLKIRESIWNKYNEAFSGLPLQLPAKPPLEDRHALHLYIIILETDSLSREGFREMMHAENIGTGIHYNALHLHDFYKRMYGYRGGDFPNAEYINGRMISLPLSSKLTEKDTDDVIAAVNKIIA